MFKNSIIIKYWKIILLISLSGAWFGYYWTKISSGCPPCPPQVLCTPCFEPELTIGILINGSIMGFVIGICIGIIILSIYDLIKTKVNSKLSEEKRSLKH